MWNLNFRTNMLDTELENCCSVLEKTMVWFCIESVVISGAGLLVC